MLAPLSFSRATLRWCQQTFCQPKVSATMSTSRATLPWGQQTSCQLAMLASLSISRAILLWCQQIFCQRFSAIKSAVAPYQDLMLQASTCGQVAYPNASARLRGRDAGWSLRRRLRLRVGRASCPPWGLGSLSCRLCCNSAFCWFFNCEAARKRERERKRERPGGRGKFVEPISVSNKQTMMSPLYGAKHAR